MLGSDSEQLVGEWGEETWPTRLDTRLPVPRRRPCVGLKLRPTSGRRGVRHVLRKLECRKKDRAKPTRIADALHSSGDATFLGIDHVQLAAPPGCEAEARRFFGALLGLHELPKPAPLAARGGLWFQCGGQQIHIGVEGDFRPAKKAHPAFRLSDEAALRSLRERLVAAGVRTRDDQEIEATARFFAEDPWGNRLEFVASPTCG
jgi:catechol 2,3-dioxygenase-like lactoylglutathione lyase family enzyme